ncbi:MAG: hypothetical protein OEL83_10320 [Desulforhopalus sp.]|nr:hypothetical protein [Desulforhopalus sp.]
MSPYSAQGITSIKIKRLARILFHDLRKNPLLTLLSDNSIKIEIEYLFFFLRWIMPLALLVRFILHEDKDGDKGLTLYTNYDFYIILIFFIIYLFFTHKKFHSLNNQTEASEKNWGKFTSVAVFFDISFITAFYVLANNPRSEIPIMYFIPLVWSAIYVPLKKSLFGIISVGISFTVGTGIIGYQSLNSTNLINELIEMTLVLMPKLLFLPIVVLFLLWNTINRKLQENMLLALFEHSPEGISFIGQKSCNLTRPGSDMQILNLNAAQQRLTPNAKTNNNSCREEFQSYTLERTSVCPWCPAEKILDNKAKHSRSLTKNISPLGHPTAEEISFSDASATPCYDENGHVIAAVKFVKDVTPQVYTAFFATEVLRLQTEEDVLITSSEFFRKMYKAESARILRFDINNSNILGIVAQSDINNPSGSIVTEFTESISNEVKRFFSECPSEIDIINRKRDLKVGVKITGCLDWEEYCYPASKNPNIMEIAVKFKLERGLIIPIKSDDALLGFVLVDQPGHNVRLSQLNILQGQLAAQIAFLAVDRAKSFSAKNEEINTGEKKTKSLNDIQTLCVDMLKSGNKDEILGKALIGTTSGPGLGYSRAIYLSLIDNTLKFELGIGPITEEEAGHDWQNSKDIDNMSEYYQSPNWLSGIQSNHITTQCKICPHILLKDIENSVVVQSINNIQGNKGGKDDSFRKTHLAIHFGINSDFVVSPVFSGKTVIGIIIADKRHHLNNNISFDKIQHLFFLTAFTGACAISSQLNRDRSDAPERFLLEVLRLLQSKYDNEKVNVYKLYNVALKVGERLGCTKNELRAIKVSSLAICYTHFCFPDSLIFGDERLESPMDNSYIFNHPDRARGLIRQICGDEEIANSAYQHTQILGKYPESSSYPIKVARILGICEGYLAITEPKNYRKETSLDHDKAIEELRIKLGTNENLIIDALDLSMRE